MSCSDDGEVVLGWHGWSSGNKLGFGAEAASTVVTYLVNVWASVVLMRITTSKCHAKMNQINLLLF